MGSRNNTPGQRRIRDGTTHCALCERKLYKLKNSNAPDNCTIDHFYPLDSGEGLNRGWNKIIICRRCNLLKGNSMPDEFINRCQGKLKYCEKPVLKVDLESIINNATTIEARLAGYYLMRDVI